MLVPLSMDELPNQNQSGSPPPPIAPQDQSADTASQTTDAAPLATADVPGTTAESVPPPPPDILIDSPPLPPATEMPPVQPPVPPPVPPPPPPQSGEVSLAESPPLRGAEGEGGSWFRSKMFLSMLVVLILAGVLVAGLYIRQRQAPRPDVATDTELTPSPAPPVAPSAPSLSLESPREGQVATGGEILMKGRTTPQTTVVFFSEREEGSLESDATGAFSATPRLVKGINRLTVSAVNTSGAKTAAVAVLLDPEGDSSQTARIGNVETISDKMLTIRETTGGTTEIITNTRTEIIGGPAKHGDLVAAIASRSGQIATESAQLLATKLFVDEGGGAVKRFITGVVSGINESVITVSDRKNPDTFYNLTATASAVFKTQGSTPATFASLVLGGQIAAVAKALEDNSLAVLLIHILSAIPR